MSSSRRRRSRPGPLLPDIPRVVALGVVLLALSVLSPLPAGAQNLPAGLAFLSQSQNTDGTWGDPAGTGLRDTTVVLDTLALFGQTGSDYLQGIANLHNTFVANTDWLARQTHTLARTSEEVSGLSAALLELQEGAIVNAAQPNFPGRGWGLGAGFTSDTLDSALALRALRAAGFNGGLSVVEDEVAAGTTSPAYAFEVPASATDLVIFVRATSGAIRLLVTRPDENSLSQDLDPSGVPVPIGPFVVQAGTWHVAVENRDAGPVTYTLEAGFTRADGFDVFRLTTALTYLGLAQNSDGGWGIAPGAASHLMLTAEVLRTLHAWGNAFAPAAALERGVAWLTGNHQNADGGFGSAPEASTVYETGLATVAIGLVAPGSPALEDATAFLAGRQLGNGSWNDDPYQSALALQALLAAQPLPAPQISSNGGAGAGADFITDLDTVLFQGTAPFGTLAIAVNDPTATADFDPTTGAFTVMAGLNEGENALQFFAVNGFGQAGLPTSLSVTRDPSLSGQVLSLEADLNPVGIALDPANPLSAVGLLELLGPAAQAVQRLDSTTGLYDTVARNGAGGFTGADFPIGFLAGFNVVMTASGDTRIVGQTVVPALVDLLAGPNMLTLPDPPPALTAFDLLQLIGDDTVVSGVQRLHPLTGAFETAVYDAGVPAGTNFPIDSGVAYLLFMHTDLFGFVLPMAPPASVMIIDPADGTEVQASPVTVSGTVGGVEPVTVTVNDVPATVSGDSFSADVPLTAGLNTIAAVATDARGRTASDTITVSFEPVLVIPRGGMAAGSRIFTADAAVLDQVAFFSANQLGVPEGVTYTTDGVSRPSATVMRVDFTIEVAAAASLGMVSFQVEYSLLDSGMRPLGPLLGNVLTLHVDIVP